MTSSRPILLPEQSARAEVTPRTSSDQTHLILLAPPLSFRSVHLGSN